MSRPLMDGAGFREAHAAFHKLWTAAVGTPGYDKREWIRREAELIAKWRCEVPS